MTPLAPHRANEPAVRREARRSWVGRGGGEGAAAQNSCHKKKNIHNTLCVCFCTSYTGSLIQLLLQRFPSSDLSLRAFWPFAFSQKVLMPLWHPRDIYRSPSTTCPIHPSRAYAHFPPPAHALCNPSPIHPGSRSPPPSDPPHDIFAIRKKKTQHIHPTRAPYATGTRRPPNPMQSQPASPHTRLPGLFNRHPPPSRRQRTVSMGLSLCLSPPL